MCKIKVAVDFGQARIKYAFEKIVEIEEIKEEKETKEETSKKVKGKTKKAKEIKKTIEKGVFPNRYFLGKNNSDSGYIVERDDHTVEIGGIEGISNNEDNKMRMEHIDDTLLVVAKEIKDRLKADDNIHMDLVTLLPPSQFRTIGKAFKDKLLNIGTITGTVNATTIKLSISNVSIVPEGIAQMKIVNLKELKEYDKALLLDIGASTIDVVSLEKINNRWKIEKADSIDRVNGSIIIQDIANKLSEKYPLQTFKSDYLEQSMAYYIGENKYELINDVEYASDRISQLKKLILNKYYTGGKILLSGGGAEFLDKSEMFLNICKPATPILLDDDVRLYGNAIGALKS